MARTNKNRAPALAYLRTSSAANVGTDKDSEKRQRHAIQGFAKRAGFGIVDEFYDAAVSGADPIETRAGFAALLDRIEGNGVRTVIVEDASRFARELMAQELGIPLLISRGVRLLTASGDDLTASDDPTRKMMRQIAGAFAETQRFSNLGIFALGLAPGSPTTGSVTRDFNSGTSMRFHMFRRRAGDCGRLCQRELHRRSLGQDLPNRCCRHQRISRYRDRVRFGPQKSLAFLR